MMVKYYYLLMKLISSYQGVILIDSPGLNTEANRLLRSLGFIEISHTVRMYKGKQPSISMNEIYGLAFEPAVSLIIFDTKV